MKNFIPLLFLLAILFPNPNYAQTSLSKSQLLEEATYYFLQGNYLAALPFYSKLDSLYPNPEHKFKLGICYLKKADDVKKSIKYLEEVLTEKPKTEDLYFYLGRAYSMNYRFDDAIRYYNDAKVKKTSKEILADIDRYIMYCENGKKLIENPIDVKIENIGRPVNSMHAEYVPVISADESIMIYTYRGNKSTGGKQNEYAEPDSKGDYYEDVFMSVKLDGENWSEPERIGENINTHGHDASLALSANGQKLFVYKDTEGTSGDIYVSELEGYEWGLPTRLDSNINTSHWEGGVSMSADENTLYFSSEKPGGYGKRDIYKSTRKEDGTWGPAINLGSKINTINNDESPFIHPDSRTLFFSSEGHSSIGGYDIFQTVAITDTSWTTPENIGYPINTTGDDKYYVVSADGKRGYYSSAKMGGYGIYDIYVIHLGDLASNRQLILVKGVVTANDSVAEATISVEYAKTRLPYKGYFKSNSATGKYLVILPGATNYNLTFSVPGYSPHVENINAEEITSYKEIVRDVRLYSRDFIRTFTIEGDLKIGDTYAEPASKVTIYISNSVETVSLETITDENGKFKFENVPTGYKYSFTLDEASGIQKALISGTIGSTIGPRQGVQLAIEGGSEIVSDELGKFSLEYTPPKEKDEFPVDLLMPYASSKKPNFTDSDYKNIISKYGNSEADGLVFQVQIGAYYTPENFNYSYFNELGNVTTQLLKDGITRFVVGRYKTMKEAESLRDKALKIGDRDAFIVIYYKGIRMLISEDITKTF